MKILIIEDDSNKVEKEYELLSEFDSLDIKHVLCLNAARLLLSNNFYDCLILDLKLADEVHGEKRGEAGIEFITEIIETDSYNKPMEIIVLSAYNELEPKLRETQRDYYFNFIHYSEESVEWREKLKNTIRYRILADDSKYNDVFEYKTDVAFITATSIETQALAEIEDIEWKEKRFKGDATLYYEAIIEVSKKKIRLIRAQQSEMGMAAASNLTSKIIRYFQPKYIIMVGIAAGIGDGNYGDIIVPSIIWNYSSGKYVEAEEKDGKTGIEFIPDAFSVEADVDSVEMLKLGNYQSVLKTIQEQFQHANYIKYESKLDIIVGPFACGSAVVANEQIVDEIIRAHSRKTIGLDMESYGMIYAAKHCSGVKPKALCFKSISDFADRKKDDKYQDYAAYTSANFAMYFVKNHLLV